MRTRAIVTLAAILGAVPHAAAAASDSRPEFSKADANGDGKVTVSEATKVGVPKSEAKEDDLDGDGKLTKGDWEFIDMKGESGSGSS